MPGRDKTGPAGAGKMTGRGRGLCAPKGADKEETPTRGQGRGLGRGMGRRLGRGFGRGAAQ